MCPGMMPILAWSGVITPGQLGPMSRHFVPFTKCLARTMSATGIPSVMQITSGTPAAAASMMASAAAGGGTKIRAQSGSSCCTASSTVFHTAKPSCVVPPLPGVTPPITLVPYSLQRAAWNAPSLPVIPCTTTRVLRSTRTLKSLALSPAPRPCARRRPCPDRRGPRRPPPKPPPGSIAPAKPALERQSLSQFLPLRQRHGLARTVAHVGGHDERQARLGEHPLALLDVRAFRTQHDGQREPQLADSADDA